MKKIQLLMMSVVVAFCVSVVVQDANAQDDEKKFAKAAKMLHGSWTGHAEKTAEAIEKSNIEVADERREMILERIGGLTVEFKDGTFSVSFGEQGGMDGTWKVEKVKRDEKSRVLFIHTVTDESAGGQEKSFEIHFVDKKHMKMIDLDEGGPPIILQRKGKDGDKKDKKDKKSDK